MKEITESLLQIVAGDIEGLLLENRESMTFAFQKVGNGFKISIGINLDSNGDGTIVNYDMGFDLEPKPEPPEKHKVKYKHTINESQPDLFAIPKIISCPLRARLTREGACSELVYCSFTCLNHCRNGERAQRAV